MILRWISLAHPDPGVGPNLVTLQIAMPMQNRMRRHSVLVKILNVMMFCAITCVCVSLTLLKNFHHCHLPIPRF